MRPKFLARSFFWWYAWQHAIKVVKKKYDFEKFICLPTSLRSNNDIIKCINKLDYKSDMIIAIQKREKPMV